MRKLSFVALSLLLAFSLHAQKPWQSIQNISVEQAEKQFANPPAAYCTLAIWGWEGLMSKEVIQCDLDAILKKGFRTVNIEAGYHLPFAYLSPEWFKMVKVAVLEAKKRGMKVWIINEGKYPSGFAGGKFSAERPDLRMQALIVARELEIKAGEVLDKTAVDSCVISAVAVNGKNVIRLIPVKDRQISFSAGLDNWKIRLIAHDFRTGKTRSVNNPTGGKDTKNSQCDYLNPAAVRQFLDWTHEQYKKCLGSELGTTVLGFRGDEPDFSYIPWTGNMVEQFMALKGYDPTPYLGTLFIERSETYKRFKADYWDVWSSLFARNFFKQESDWHAANGLEHITHLNNDHRMDACTKAEGSFFRDLAPVQIPGVDAIWNQIWPDTINNFPKYASSVAHVYGRPRAFSESFAAYYTSPSILQAKYVVDYQMVRGISLFEFMFWPSSASKTEFKSWMAQEGTKDLVTYTNRSCYLMAQGKPAAKVAVYFPISSIWLDNNVVDKSLRNQTQLLLEHQIDFDFVDDDGIANALTVGTAHFTNKSGQRYETLIIPSCEAISSVAWDKMEKFAATGGKVLFWGCKPTLLVDKSFMHPETVPDVPAMAHEPQTDWTPVVAAAMPEAGLKISGVANKAIRYTQRTLSNGDLSFVFNESKEKQTVAIEVNRVGIVKQWNALNGEITVIPAKVSDHGTTLILLNLDPYESTILTVEKRTRDYSVADFSAVGDGVTVNTKAIQSAIDKAYADGGGRIVVPKGTFMSGALFFKPEVDLYVSKEAVLKGVVDPAAYPVIPTRFEGIERVWKSAFLNFGNSQGVIVAGEGTIDGNGVAWKNIPFGSSGRPRLICFTNCNNGKISGLHLRDQASWCVHVLYTSGFTVDSLDIRAEHTIPSSDGLDIDSSDDVKVANTYFEANDDCISIKSGKDEDGRRVARPSENILIENCRFGYGHGGVAFGSEISGNVRHVLIRNCTFGNANRSLVRFKSQPSRGGVVEDIEYRNITVDNVESVFDINTRWRMVSPLAPPADKPTQLKNIRIVNLKGTCQAAGLFSGDEYSLKDSFHFENCYLIAQKGLVVSGYKGLDFNGLLITVPEGNPIIFK